MDSPLINTNSISQYPGTPVKNNVIVIHRLQGISRKLDFEEIQTELENEQSIPLSGYIYSTPPSSPIAKKPVCPNDQKQIRNSSLKQLK